VSTVRGETDRQTDRQSENIISAVLGGDNKVLFVFASSLVSGTIIVRETVNYMYMWA